MIRSVLDLLFPPRCAGCGRRGAWICRRCASGLTRLPPTHCPICARPSATSHVCSWCFDDPPAFDTLRCGFLFEGTIRTAIHRLKYGGARHLAEPLAVQMIESVGPIRSPSAVVPVPLHPRRLADRGYNQSALLAQVIARRLNAPVVADGLRRIKDTAPQVSLPGPARWENVRDAFDATPGDLSGASALVIDDVATTGSTLRAAAAALKRAGVARVDALVLARAP